jgi:hypothetical protein
MGGLRIPLHGRGGGAGRPYPPATRPEEPTLATVAIEPTVGQLIDENLRKQKAFIDRHEKVPATFVDELRKLLERIS